MPQSGKRGHGSISRSVCISENRVFLLDFLSETTGAGALKKSPF